LIKFNKKKLDDIFAGFSGKRIMIIGDLMLDEYLIGRVSRISPEAPVPVVEITEESHRLGGAANVALNIASLGVESVMVGVIGNDSAGEKLMEQFEKSDVRIDGIIKINDRPTTIKTRVIGDSQHIARVDKEQSNYLNPEEEQNICQIAGEILDSVDAVIIEDYNKGVLTEKLISDLIDRANEKEKIITVDPKFKNFLNYHNITLFKPNIKETEQALAIKINNDRDLIEAGKTLMNTLMAKNILITRGANGMSLFEKDGRVTHLESRVRKVADVSGAGDTVISTLTAALTAGSSIQEAATIANYAAGIVCEYVGIVPIEKEKLYRVCLGQDTE
jgi:rfaE bifunctional protein kinase chain/domain